MDLERMDCDDLGRDDDGDYLRYQFNAFPEA